MTLPIEAAYASGLYYDGTISETRIEMKGDIAASQLITGGSVHITGNLKASLVVARSLEVTGDLDCLVVSAGKDLIVHGDTTLGWIAGTASGADSCRFNGRVHIASLLRCRLLHANSFVGSVEPLRKGDDVLVTVNCPEFGGLKVVVDAKEVITGLSFNGISKGRLRLAVNELPLCKS